MVLTCATQLLLALVVVIYILYVTGCIFVSGKPDSQSVYTSNLAYWSKQIYEGTLTTVSIL